MRQKEVGKRRTVWLPTELDRRAEKARKTLGLGRSGFYRFAIVEVVRNLVQKKTNSAGRKEDRNAEMPES